MAKFWIETKKDLPGWNACKEKLGGLFSKPVGHQLGAKKELATRVDLNQVVRDLHAFATRLTPK